SSRAWSFQFLLVLGLAGASQFFLAQKNLPSTLWSGLGFYLFSLLVLFKILRPTPATKNPSPIKLSLKTERLLFGIIFTIAVFFRIYKLQEFPDGLFSDRAEVAFGALRILKEHWRPFFEAFSLQVPELWIYYLVAGWFKLFGSSPDLFSYFDVALALAGLPFVYWTFRQISGVPTALLTLFLLSTMRWNFLFARKINFDIQMIFFMFATLSFLFYGFRQKKSWAFLVSAGFLAFGFYSYQAFKAFPLFLLACGLFELWKKPKEAEKHTKNLLAFFLVTFVLVSPLLVWMVEQGSLGRRESEVSILTTIQRGNSLRPVFRNIVDWAEFFNRRYDTNGQSNYQGRRMLDDLTGTLFLLALAYGVSRIRERPAFYALGGIGVMSLPALLSENGGHAGRMLGVAPFVAYLCALLIMEFKNRLDWISKSFRWRGWFFPGTLFYLLGLVALINFRNYFKEQVLEPVYLNDFSW
ncbi:MAG TPA: glycosyltransferase family 39 protein, partial [bacterium]